MLVDDRKVILGDERHIIMVWPQVGAVVLGTLRAESGRGGMISS